MLTAHNGLYPRLVCQQCVGPGDSLLHPIPPTSPCSHHPVSQRCCHDLKESSPFSCFGSQTTCASLYPTHGQIPLCRKRVSFFYSLTSAKFIEPCILSPHSRHCTNTKALCVRERLLTHGVAHALGDPSVHPAALLHAPIWGHQPSPKTQLATPQVTAQLRREPATPHVTSACSALCRELSAALLLRG